MFYLLVLFTQSLLFLPLLEIMLSLENIKIYKTDPCPYGVYILYDITEVNLKKGVLVRRLI